MAEMTFDWYTNEAPFHIHREDVVFQHHAGMREKQDLKSQPDLGTYLQIATQLYIYITMSMDL